MTWGFTHPGKGACTSQENRYHNFSREDGSAPAVHAAFYLWQLGEDELRLLGVDFG